MGSIDFERLKGQVKLQYVLDLVGWDSQECTGRQRRGYCPVHSVPGHKSRSFAVQGEKWYCHVCKLGGDAVDLYHKYTGATLQKTVILLCHKLGIRVPWKGEGKGPQKPDKPRQLSLFNPEQEEERSGGRGVSPRTSLPDRGEAPPN